jgi:hypothetical protein
MTGGGFHADIERLERHGGEFGGHADRAGEIATRLRQTLDGLHGCWGSDEVGNSFAAGHVTEASAALSRVGSLADQLGAVGDRFTETAAAYRDTESDNLGVLRLVDPGADR